MQHPFTDRSVLSMVVNKTMNSYGAETYQSTAHYVQLASVYEQWTRTATWYNQ